MVGCYLCNGRAEWASLDGDRVMIACYGTCRREFVVDRAIALRLRSDPVERRRGAVQLSETPASPTDVLVLSLEGPAASGAVRVERATRAIEVLACRARFGAVGRSKALSKARTAWTALSFRAGLDAPFAERRILHVGAGPATGVWVDSDMGGVALAGGLALRKGV